MCGARALELVVEFGEHAIARRFLVDRDAPEYTHPVTLCLCRSCGLIQLVNPIPPAMLYSECFCMSGWKYQPHVPRLVELIRQVTGLRENARILEAGSCDGTFLETLSRAGYRSLRGIEPAREAREAALARGVPTVDGYFSSASASRLVAEHGQCDLLVARQVLEHVGELDEFLSAIHTVLSPRGFVIIEVPNFDFHLRSFDYSAVWEEHVNYFTLATLRRYLAGIGIEIVHAETAVFSGEALIVIGRFRGGVRAEDEGVSSDLDEAVWAYRRQWPVFRAGLQGYLRDLRTRGDRAALYGAGCRASSLVNFTGVTEYFEFAVDDQREKQGLYMAGSHLPVLPSEALVERGIDVCFLAVNAENEEKVIRRHGAFVDRGGRFTSLLPPSARLVSV